MTLSKQRVVAALAWALATPAYASEPRVIGWDELAPEPVTYDNHLVDEQRTDWLFFARGSGDERRPADPNTEVR